MIELFSITFFALILEYLSIKTYDAYQYSPDFIFQFGNIPDNVPVVIAFAWAIIIGTSMKISDISNVSNKTKPFLDTLLALTIDLSMDVIAIRIDAGLWNWKIGISNSITFDSFIGVRYGNFIGWYFIVLIYSVLIRYGRGKYQNNEYAYSGYLSMIPLLGLIPFYIIFDIIQQGKRIFNYSPYFMIVVIILIYYAVNQVFTSLQNHENKNVTHQSDNLMRIELVAYYSFHIFFLMAFFALKLYQSAPLIVIPSVLAILIHIFSHYLFIVKSETSKRTFFRNFSLGR
ncbi:MAG: hypothetical protein HeimC2_05910 [Candidatus Heimdallarchaeota archaeon LC_2]|nr:MAG: hypothetical protein HeimC2_05910 [Candidatus Heimdallarchaeota archaeon LC_2]